MWKEGQSVRGREGGSEGGREEGRVGEEGERAREGRRMSGSKKDTCTRRAREGRCLERVGGSNSGVPHRLTLRPHTNRFPNTIPYQLLTERSQPSSLGWVPCLCRCRRASPASPPDPGH